MNTVPDEMEEIGASGLQKIQEIAGRAERRSDIDEVWK
jgi:hypothetical protein